MLVETDKRLAQQAYETILELVLSGNAEPGELLTERRLADTLNMSRTPIRDALLMLESEGLLIRHGTRGLQVKQMRIDDFMEVLHVRQLLEPEAARLAAGRISADTLDTLIDDLNVLLQDAAKGERPERDRVRSVDERLHGAISESAGNRQLAGIIQSLRHQTLIFDLRNMPERLDATCHEHLDLISHLKSGDGDKAATSMSQHLDRIRESIIRRLSLR